MLMKSQLYVCMHSFSVPIPTTRYSTSVGPNQNVADEEVALSLQEWCSMQANKCAYFDFWMKALSFKLLLLVYIRSIREGNFDMYVESLAEIVTGPYTLLKVAVRGGAIGLSRNPGALRRWTVTGPEIVRITKEFEGD